MKYFCYYDYSRDGHEKRSNPPAAATKLLYIAKCLSRIEPTLIVSASGVIGKKTDRTRTDRITDGLSVRYFFSLGRKNRVCGKFGTVLIQFQLLLYLLFKVSGGEKIIVYHSLGYMRIIKAAKKIKRFKLILEVEEIYADVSTNNRIRQKELVFFRSADAFLFPTKILSNTINCNGKPEVIIHGTYQVEADRRSNVFVKKPPEDTLRTIHCVYAGTLDHRKGGAAAAAAAAEHLPKNYHIHILGFGSETEVLAIKDLIAEISGKSKAKVTYDGLLFGEDYIRFIQSCDIGLCTQNPDAAFNATSFPSKILSYMANGLRVVSIRIPAIEQSAVGGQIYYYDEQTPEKIAEAILSVNTESGYNSRELIHTLSEQFARDIRSLVNEKM